jgi:tetratricopeptide (TPR) repeat protein
MTDFTRAAGEARERATHPIPSPRVRLVCAALAVLCVFIYAPGLGNEFVWDDELHLTRNPVMEAGLSLRNLRWALTTFHAGNWHPLTWVSHLIDVELFGLSPRGHHLTSLLLHCANAVLTFLVLKRMTGLLWGSAVVAALFAAHPLHVESVAWVAERKDVLSTFFWLLALGAWLGWLREPRPARYAAATALFALALGAKAMPVTFPFLLLLLDWWPFGRFVPGRRMALAVEKLPLVALAAASGVITFLAQSTIGAVGDVPFLFRLANAVQSYWKYVGKAFWPARLAMLYPLTAEAPSLVTTALALAGLAAVTFVTLRFRRRRPALAVGWFWFLGTLVPVIGLVQVGTQAMADRYTYVPLTGLFIIAVWGIGGLAHRAPRRSAWFASGATIIVGLLTAAASAQVGLWRDPPTAFSNVLRVSGESWIAHSRLGVYYHEHGDDRLAEEHVRAALAISENDVDNRSNLGKLLARQGRIEEALPQFREALRLSPQTALYHADLGAALAALGRLDEGIFELREALRLDPGLEIARENLNKALSERGARGK